MVTGALIKILEHADNPRIIRATARALEFATGLTTKAVAIADTRVAPPAEPSGDWYTRNGFYRLASQYGTTNYTGRLVTPETALESTAFYAGTKIIAEDMGGLPFFTYRRSADRARVDKAYDHPLYRCLHDLVNPDVSSGEFVESLTAHAILGLDGFAEIQRFESGVYLWPWQPGGVTVARNQAGRRVYLYRDGGGPEKTYAANQVFHLRGYTLDCQRGDPILVRARHAIGITLAAEEYAGRFFSQDATPGIVLERPLEAPPIDATAVQRIKEAWIKWHRGLKNKWEPAVLTEGMKANVLTPKAAEAQLIEQRTFQILEVCRLLRLSPHKLAELNRMTYSNVEQYAIDHVTFTLMPWVRRWRDAVYRCLLTVDEQMAGRIWAEHSVEALQRGDFKAQTEGWRVLLDKGVLCINDVLRWLNLNPIPGGDEHFIQLNMATVGDIAAGASLPSTVVPVRAKE